MHKGDRLQLGILFGGKSAEHDVSVTSAQGVIAASDQRIFQVVPIGITKQGTWLGPSDSRKALTAIRKGRLKSLEESPEAGAFYCKRALSALQNLDVVFPLVHGLNGEDGSLQGFLELAGLAYVGAGVAASAVGMDKGFQQAIFRDVGLLTPASFIITASAWANSPSAPQRRVEEEFGYPCFVKPVNGGSSIGISRVLTARDLGPAIKKALQYDRRALVQEAIDGRHLEVALLGNNKVEASPVGEITFHGSFYDYAAKYKDPTTTLAIPADIPANTAERLRNLSVKAFKAIDCAGLARADFFLTSDDQIYLCEINSLPGFTPRSMFPLLWKEGGLSYQDLVTRLVRLALERQQEKQNGL